MATIDEIMKPHEAMLDLLRRCLEVDPRRRITCAEALKHRFF
jgi:serine/threonine protein kinase